MQLGGLGVRCKLPSGSGRSPATNDFDAFLAKKICFLRYPISRIFLTGGVYTAYTRCMSMPVYQRNQYELMQQGRLHIVL